jgi:hypothetical protein
MDKIQEPSSSEAIRYVYSLSFRTAFLLTEKKSYLVFSVLVH